MADLARPNYGVTGLDTINMRLLTQESMMDLHALLPLDSQSVDSEFGKQAQLKEQNPVDKDAINIIRYRRRRATKDEPGHVATALYKSRQKRIIIYDSSRHRSLLEQYKDQLRAYHIHTEEDYVKVAMSHGYTTQDTNFTCAYNALFAAVLLLNQKNPDHYLMNNDGMWRMMKMATDTPNEMPDTIEELSEMVAWPKEEKKRVRLNYYPLKGFIQVAPTKSTFESTSATSVGPAESTLESSSATIAIKYMDGVLKPATTTLAASEGIASRVKALKEESGHIGAPMKETILDVTVKVGDKVAAKQTLYVLSAMKMEMAVESKIAGIVSDVILKTGETVEAEDLIIIVKAN